MHYSRTLSRITLDHFPLVLKFENLSWAPTPFRFTNHLLVEKNFQKLFGDLVVKHFTNGLSGVYFHEKA